MNINKLQINANVIIVDWGKGASSSNYFQAAANTRIVASIITKSDITSKIHMLLNLKKNLYL